MRSSSSLRHAAVFVTACAAAAPVRAKQSHTSFPAVTYQLAASDNFALKWQAERVTVDAADARAVLDVFEDAYGRLHGELGHGLPYGSDLYRMNVYVSDAGGTPEIDTYGGYLSFGLDDHPYIVLSHSMIAQGDPGTALVAVHEYYHAIQYGTGAYWGLPGPYDTVGWYYEACANWAVTQVYPDDDVVFGDLGPYLEAPEQPLFLAAFDEHSPLLGHEYGAFLFPLFLDQLHGGPELIRDSWERAGPDDDPLEVLDALTLDAPIGALFAEFAARNAAWDYPTGTRQMIEAWLPRLGPAPAVLRVGPDGTDGTVSIDPARVLHAYGYHLIEIELPGDAARLLELEAEPLGSAGTPSELRATLVVPDGASFTYMALTFEQGRAVIELAEGALETTVYLAVACCAETRDPGETFDYQLRVGAVDGAPREAPTPTEGAQHGCGCCSQRRGAAAPAWILALLLLSARRRAPGQRAAPVQLAAVGGAARGMSAASMHEPRVQGP